MERLGSDPCGEATQTLVFFSGMSVEFQVGDVIGDYQITGVLGGGGMGKVYRVRNRLSDRAEAMKVVLPSREGDADLAERFLREIKIQARPGTRICPWPHRARRPIPFYPCDCGTG